MKEKREWQYAEPWLMVVRFCALLIFLYTAVAFMRPWPYPLKAELSLLRSFVRIDTPVWLYGILAPFLLFSAVFQLLSMFSLLMRRSRFTEAAGRIGQVYWAADAVICICCCLGGKAVPGVTMPEIFLDVLCICLVSAAIRLRRKKAVEDALQEKTEVERAEAAAWEKKRSKIMMIVFSVLISMQLFGAFCFYAVFLRGDELQFNPKNSIISGHYKGWHRVSLDESHQFILPGDWELTENGGFLYIEDSTGRKAAIGKQFSQWPETEEINEMLSVYYGKTVLDCTSFDGARSQCLNNWDCEWYESAVTFDDGQEQHVIKMVLEYGSYVDGQHLFYFCFGDPDEDLCTKASAIIYSFDK